MIRGAQDPFCDEALFRKEADGIPDARLIIYAGKGVASAGKQFERDVLSFLREDLPEASGM